MGQILKMSINQLSGTKGVRSYENVGSMKVGGKRWLVLPPDLAYGDRGAPPDIAGGAVLVFLVELLGVR